MLSFLKMSSNVHKFSIWAQTIQIQTRFLKDHMKNENQTILFMDLKIKMFHHEGVRNVKVILSLSIFFSYCIVSQLLVGKKR